MPKVPKRQRNSAYVKFLIAQELEAERVAARKRGGTDSPACSGPWRGTRLSTRQSSRAVPPKESVIAPVAPQPCSTTASDGGRPRGDTYDSSRRSTGAGDDATAPAQKSIVAPLGPLPGSIAAADQGCPGGDACDSSRRSSLAGDDSGEAPIADRAWEYPISRHEKQMRLIMLLDKERMAAREEVRRLKRLSVGGFNGGNLLPAHSLDSSCGCGDAPSTSASPASSLDPPLGHLAASMDYPFSRNEKQLILTRLLCQERASAEREALFLRTQPLAISAGRPDGHC
uniref:Uncharacterized protein n=1 Tax=Alexandrium andersonii TaxID=327968 RepID=A0A7S2G2C7_9DINO|mmetsp:Transcript_39388/g.89543  ORF Transcript_39388/g.89543 Transcript_39388/m.89543 type:complete len:285 (+) Transcript_39388:63-917(+)